MPYNLKFYKTESATARCLAGTGAETSYTASSQSIIAQRDVDRKALGWATAAAQSTLECALPGPAGVIGTSPTGAFSAAGYEGGPFSPTSAQYTLTNEGTADMAWSVSGPAWLSFAPSSGFLYVGESVVVTVTLGADALTPGVYTSPMVFSNDTAGTTTSLGASVDVWVIPVPEVAAAFVSEGGTATLIGHSEFADAGASVPPKKYLTKTASGTLQECVSNTLSCAGPFSSAKYVYSGAASYDAVTGALTNTFNLATYSTAGSCPAADFAGDTPQAPSWGDTTVASVSCTQTNTVTKTRVDRIRSGACCDDIPTLGRSTTASGSQYWELSTEDTEDNAMNRAVKTPGTSNTATHEARGAGDFSFEFVEVSFALNFTNLAVGKSYTATVDILTENYGGGGGVTTQRTYNFTASAATHTENDALVPVSGQQITASNPSVAVDP